MSSDESSEPSASSEWQSYISSSHAETVPNRLSLLSRGSSCQDKLKRRSAAFASLQLPIALESRHSHLSTTLVDQASFEGGSKSLVAAPSLIDRTLFHNADPKQQNPSIFLFSPPTVTSPNAHPYNWEIPCIYHGVGNMSNDQMPNMKDLITRLGSDEDAVRKMAVFKLQSLINDPAFADFFIQEGGLSRLRWLILRGTGNTLAYALSSFARLLELDLTDNRGWECADGEVIEKVVELVVCHPLVNILRGAMAILVSIVSRPYLGEHAKPSPTPGAGGFQALKPAISIYPQFLEMLVSRLSSADHALCANALQLINSLMRDAITNDPSETEWPKFIKRLQDLGVIKAVYVLMQSSALQDLAHPLLEFQALTKVLLRRWRDITVDLLKPEHRRTIKGIHLASKPEPSQVPRDSHENNNSKPKHNPQKWRRLGFMTESPEPDFHEMGFLGMMDLADFVRSHQDEFQTILAEQALLPPEQRCPVARASLVVTGVLYEHFEVERHDWEDSKAYMQLESRTNFEKVFKPLLLQWSRLHTAGLRAYLRLWKATRAKMGGEDEGKDFTRIVELVRILVESVVGGSTRSQGVDEVEKEMEAYEVAKLRGLQMELLELTYEDVWGQHLRGVREELMSEALQFVKEQRVRCLLNGAWFPVSLGYHDSSGGSGPIRESGLRRSVVSGGWRFVRLDEQKKYLHYGDYEEVQEISPEVTELEGKLDLSIVSSVVSNVTASGDNNSSNGRGSVSSDSTVRGLGKEDAKLTTTKITIHGYLPEKSSSKRHHHKQSTQSSHTRMTSRSSNRTQPKESVLLTIHPQSQMSASEWLDGLLMLLEQQPITAETNRLVQTIGGFGVRVRLLNVRGGDGEEEFGDGEQEGKEGPPVQVPSRDGLEGEEYYYRM